MTILLTQAGTLGKPLPWRTLRVMEEGMLALAFSAAIAGIDAHVVRVETDSAAGIPHFAIVGLPDRALNESRERIRAALVNSGFGFPPGRLLANLAPADMRGSILYRSGDPKLNTVEAKLNTAHAQGALMPLTDTTAGMWSLALDVQSRLPEKVVLILRLAEYLPLDEVLTMRSFPLLDAGMVKNGMVLHGVRDGDVTPFWLPEDLSQNVSDFYWKRRRNVRFERVRSAEHAGVVRRYFYWGEGVAIAASDIFALIARTIRNAAKSASPAS